MKNKYFVLLVVTVLTTYLVSLISHPRYKKEYRSKEAVVHCFDQRTEYLQRDAYFDSLFANSTPSKHLTQWEIDSAKLYYRCDTLSLNMAKNNLAWAKSASRLEIFYHVYFKRDALEDVEH